MRIEVLPRAGCPVAVPPATKMRLVAHQWWHDRTDWREAHHPQYKLARANLQLKYKYKAAKYKIQIQIQITEMQNIKQSI